MVGGLTIARYSRAGGEERAGADDGRRRGRGPVAGPRAGWPHAPPGPPSPLIPPFADRDDFPRLAPDAVGTPAIAGRWPGDPPARTRVCSAESHYTMPFSLTIDARRVSDQPENPSPRFVEPHSSFRRALSPALDRRPAG